MQSEESNLASIYIFFDFQIQEYAYHKSGNPLGVQSSASGCDFIFCSKRMFDLFVSLIQTVEKELN